MIVQKEGRQRTLVYFQVAAHSCFPSSILVCFVSFQDMCANMTESKVVVAKNSARCTVSEREFFLK